jgi:hypothetical protein
MGKAEPYKRLQWFVKVMVVILVMAMAGPLVVHRCSRSSSPPSEPPPIPIPAPTDRSLALPEWIRALRPTQKEDEGSRHFTVYRWKDDQGNWHYADRPPADGAGEEVVMDRNEGITTLPVHDTGPIAAPAPEPVNPPPADPVTPLVPTLNPVQIKARAEEAKALLEEHFQQQQQVLDQGTTP